LRLRKATTPRKATNGDILLLRGTLGVRKKGDAVDAAFA